MQISVVSFCHKYQDQEMIFKNQSAACRRGSHQEHVICVKVVILPKMNHRLKLPTVVFNGQVK